jgi:hypothetical protein
LGKKFKGFRRSERNELLNEREIYEEVFIEAITRGGSCALT